MKNYVVTLLLSILVVLVGVTLRRSTAKAANAQTKTISPIVDLAPTPNNLIPVGIGPLPCPPYCPK